VESVPETDAVPHVLAEDDGDESVEPDGLSVPLLQLDSEGLRVVDTVGEVEDAVEIVGIVEGEPETDGERDCEPHGDAV